MTGPAGLAGNAPSDGAVAEAAAATAAPAGAVGVPEFDALMARCGPFERGPRLAVAVSGGADSLALALLSARWAAAQDGTVTGLTVDHGLRPGSRTEALGVRRTLAARGIAHRTLVWRGLKPAPGRPVQEAARAARYALLLDWCRQNGVLHLLLAHHREDQAETVLLRLAHGTGPEGLAGMAPIAETRWARLLRPLLGLPAARLRATLAAEGVGWIEDPSNRDPAHERVRLRRLLPALSEDGLDPARLAAAAAGLGRARAAVDDAAAALLAAAVALYPTGHARLDPAPFRAAPAPLARRALADLLRCVGGRAYPPRAAALARLAASLTECGPKRARTLGGCVVAPKAGVLEVRREATVRERLTLSPGLDAVWDGRFRVTVPRGAGSAGRPGEVAALGVAGWSRLVTERPALRRAGPSAAVAATLPAVWRGGEPILVPGLGWAAEPGAAPAVRIAFSPGRALAPASFSVV